MLGSGADIGTAVVVGAALIAVRRAAGATAAVGLARSCACFRQYANVAPPSGGSLS